VAAPLVDTALGFKEPSVLCDCTRKSLSMAPHVLLSEPGTGRRAINALVAYASYT
jgi:hypothetical protein